MLCVSGRHSVALVVIRPFFWPIRAFGFAATVKPRQYNVSCDAFLLQYVSLQSSVGSVSTSTVHVSAVLYVRAGTRVSARSPRTARRVTASDVIAFVMDAYVL